MTKEKINWDKIFTPITIAKLTIVRKTMTEEEFKISNEISNNWMKYIKENFKPKDKND